MSVRFSGEGNPFYGKTHSLKTREKISLYRRTHSSAFKGKHHTSDAIEANRLAHLGKRDSPEVRHKKSLATRNGNNPRAIRVKCIETNEEFECIKFANEKYKIDKGLINKCCKGEIESAGGYH